MNAICMIKMVNEYQSVFACRQLNGKGSCIQEPAERVLSKLII